MVQSQLRQLLLKLAAPKGMNADEHALLAAVEAFYGVADFALATRDVTTRADNIALLSALGENSPLAGCLGRSVRQLCCVLQTMRSYVMSNQPFGQRASSVSLCGCCRRRWLH